jgi:hypothetical protein
MSQFPATTNTSCYAVAFRFESLAGWSYFAIFNQNPSHSNHHIPDNLTISGHLLDLLIKHFFFPRRGCFFDVPRSHVFAIDRVYRLV